MKKKSTHHAIRIRYGDYPMQSPTYSMSGLRCLLAVMLLLVVSYTKAQTITYPSGAQPLTRGMGSSLLTVNVAFPNACTGVNVEIRLPNGVEYVTGSVVKTGGAGSLTISDAGGTLNKPLFAISNAASGNDITFTIARIANCGTGSSGKDSIYVTGSCGNRIETAAEENNYNILAPALSMTPPATITNAVVGSNYNRSFTVTNGGLGCLDTLMLYVVRPSGSIGSPVLAIGATSIPADRTNGDSTFYKIAGGNLPGGDGLMCNGETVNFTESFTLVNCLGLSTFYGSSWGSEKNTLCQTVNVTGLVNLSSGVPSVSYSFSAPPITGCGTVPRQISMTITNNGTGPATNVNVLVGNSYNGAYFNYAYYMDTASIMVTPSLGMPFHPSGIVATNTIINSKNAPVCAMGQVGIASFNLPNGYVLAVGESIVLTFNVQTCTETVCSNIGTYDPGFISARINYKDQCATASYSQPLGTANIQPGVSLGANFTVEAPAQVFAGNCFDYNISGSFNITPGSGFPNSYFEYKITLPAGVTFNNLVETLHGDTPLAGYPLVSGNILTVRYRTTEQYYFQNLKLNLCVSPETCGNQALGTEIRTTPDGNCANPIYLTRCGPTNFVAVCNIPCPTGGATPITWTHQRVTFSPADDDNNGIPDGLGDEEADITKIDRTHYRPADVMRSHVSSLVTSNTTSTPYATWPFVYAEWNFSAAQWAPEGTATITIKRGGSVIHTITGIVPGVVTAATHFKADWSSSLPGGFVYQHGDSVLVDADFKIVGAITTNASSTSSPYFGYNKVSGTLSQSVYASQNANPPAGNLLGPERFSCFTPQYNYFIMGSTHLLSFNNINGNGPAGCNDFTIGGSVYNQVRGYLNDRFFPFESRPTHILDTLIFDIPVGWEFVSHNNATMDYNTNAGNIGTLTIPITPAITGNINTGTKIKYDFRSLANTPAFPFVSTEGAIFTISFKVKPTCSTPVSSVATMSENGHYLYYPSKADPTYYAISTTGTLPYNPSSQPSIVLQNNTGTVQGVAPQHFWDVQVNNPSTQTAPYVWLSLNKGTSDISIDSVVLKPSNVVLTANNYGSSDKWYALANSIGSGTNQQARIYFKYEGCNLDSIKTSIGWNCSGYPTNNPEETSACTEQIQYLKVNPQPSEIQLEFIKQPVSPIDLCTADFVDARVNSALGANVDNPSVTIVIPPGLDVTFPIQVEYPLGSNIWQDVSGTLVGNQYTIDLESHTGIGSNGLPGTILNSASPGRQARIRIAFNTSCGFISGSRFGFITNGDKPCGGPVSGNGDYINSFPITIMGAAPQGTAGLVMSMNNTLLTCGEPETLNLVITPTGFPTILGDTAVYTLPLGISYTGTLTNVSNCASCTITQATLAGGVTQLKVAIPSAVAAGTPIAFGIGIEASGSGDGCGNKTIIGELIRTGEILSCGGTICADPSKVVIGNASQVVTILKPKLDVSAFNFTQTGATINYTVQLTNNGTAASAAGYALKIYCGAPSGGVVLHTITTNALAAAGTDSYTGSFTTGGCTAGTQLVAQVDTAMANGAHPACTCSTPSPSTSAPLPVTLVSFRASKEGQTAVLEWVTTAETNSERFEIERSQSGRNWSKSGELKAKGESSEIVNYTFKDTDPENGDNLYRLKMIDQDQTFTFSRVVSLNFDIKDKVNLFPSPVSELLTIKVREWNDVKDVEMFDSNGKLVYESHRKSGVEPRQQISVKHLAQGVYMVKLNRKNGTMTTHKIVVVK